MNDEMRAFFSQLDTINRWIGIIGLIWFVGFCGLVASIVVR
jgi:hypothetical protein